MIPTILVSALGPLGLIGVLNWVGTKGFGPGLDN